MKIAYFSDTYLPTVHGVNVSIESFRKELERVGHQVFVITPYLPGYRDSNQRIVRLCSLPFLKNPQIRIGLPFSRNTKFKKIVNTKFDIVHAQTPFNLGWIAKYVSKRQKIPIVYTHHTRLAEEAASYIKSKRVLPKLARRMYVWFANKTDAVIVPSDEIRRLLKREGVKKPMHVLPTGVNMDFFSQTGESKRKALQLRKKLGIDPSEKVLIFVGRLDPEKNIEFLIRSFPLIHKGNKKVKLLIVGKGFHEGALKLLAKSVSAGRIIFTGSVPYESIPIYYQASDLFVFSSPTETQGLVILEAMASGLPVVALANGVIDSLIVDGKNGYLLKPTSVEDFAKKISDVLNSNEYDILSANSQKMAARYSSREQTKQLIRIYEKLIAENK